MAGASRVWGPRANIFASKTNVAHRSTSLYSLPSLILALIVRLSYIGLGFLGPLYGREIGLMSSAFLLAGFITTPAIGWLAEVSGLKSAKRQRGAIVLIG